MILVKHFTFENLLVLSLNYRIDHSFFSPRSNHIDKDNSFRFPGRVGGYLRLGAV